MGFIKDNLTRKEFINLINQNELIFNEASDCLKPCNNVYYHYYYANLGMTREPLSVSCQDIQISLSTLSNYIPQLIRLRSSIISLYNNNVKLLRKHENKYLESIESLETIYRLVSTLLRDTKTLNGSKVIVELKIMIAYLESLNQQLTIFKRSDLKNNFSINTDNAYSI